MKKLSGLPKISIFAQKREESDEDKQFKARLLEALSSNNEDVTESINVTFERLLSMEDLMDDSKKFINNKQAVVIHSLVGKKPLAEIIEEIATNFGKSEADVRGVFQECIDSYQGRLEICLSREISATLSDKSYSENSPQVKSLRNCIFDLAKREQITLKELSKKEDILAKDDQLQSLYSKLSPQEPKAEKEGIAALIKRACKKADEPSEKPPIGPSRGR